MADQHSGSDTCSTVTDTVTEKVQASYIYHGWNCLIYAEKHFSIYLGKDLDDYYALVVSLRLTLSCGFLPVHPLDVSQKNFHHFPFSHPVDLIMMINAFKLDNNHFYP